MKYYKSISLKPSQQNISCIEQMFEALCHSFKLVEKHENIKLVMTNISTRWEEDLMILDMEMNAV